jgi:hypothetical protein
MAGTRQHRGPGRRADMGAASAPFTTASHEIGASQCDSIRESLLSANHFGFFQGRLAAAGGRRLPEPAVGENEDARGRGGSCGASAARTTHHCREHRRLLGRGAEHVHSLCRKEWRFIGNSSPSSLTSTDSRSPGRLER